jgi:hypothetical protein
MARVVSAGRIEQFVESEGVVFRALDSKSVSKAAIASGNIESAQ